MTATLALAPPPRPRLLDVGTLGAGGTPLDRTSAEFASAIEAVPVTLADTRAPRTLVVYGILADALGSRTEHYLAVDTTDGPAWAGPVLGAGGAAGELVAVVVADAGTVTPGVVNVLDPAAAATALTDGGEDYLVIDTTLADGEFEGEGVTIEQLAAAAPGAGGEPRITRIAGTFPGGETSALVTLYGARLHGHWRSGAWHFTQPVAGAPGRGIPAGGATGQVPVKTAGGDYVLGWTDIVPRSDLDAALATIATLTARLDAIEADYATSTDLSSYATTAQLDAVQAGAWGYADARTDAATARPTGYAGIIWKADDTGAPTNAVDPDMYSRDDLAS